MTSLAQFLEYPARRDVNRESFRKVLEVCLSFVLYDQETSEDVCMEGICPEKSKLGFCLQFGFGNTPCHICSLELCQFPGDLRL